MDHVGGSIAWLWRLKIAPSAAFYNGDYQPVEGAMDVLRGDVRSSASGLHGGGDERSGSLPNVRPAP